MSSGIGDAQIALMANRIAQATGAPVDEVKAKLSGLNPDELSRLAQLDEIDFIKESADVLARPMPPPAAPSSSVELKGGGSPNDSSTTLNSKKQKKLVFAPSPQSASDSAAPEPTVDPSIAQVSASYANQPEPEQAGPAYTDPRERTREINMMFQQEAAGPEEEKMDPKTRMMLYVFGGVGAVILVIMIVLGLFMIQPSDDGYNKDPGQNIEIEKPVVIAVDPAHEWGYRLAGVQEVVIPCADMLNDNSDGFTIEARIRIENLDGFTAFEIEDTLSTPSFSLRCESGDNEGELDFRFEVPRLKARCKGTVKIDKPDEWLYITAVWDNRRRARGIRILVNGEIIAKALPQESGARIFSTGYKLIIKADDDSAVVIDEVRIRERPFFTKSYTPEKIFSQKKATVSLLHFDKKGDKESFDEGAKASGKLVLDKGTFVPVASSWLADESMPTEVPQMILSAIRRQQDGLRADEFEKKWAGYSAAEKKKYWDAYVNGKKP